MNFSNIKEKDIVAFKTTDGDWFTGWVGFVSDTSLMINLIVPIEPQWYRDEDDTVYFLDSITEVILLKSAE